MKNVRFLMIGLVFAAMTMATVGCSKIKQPRQITLYGLIQTTEDGKVFFVSHITDEGVDLVPCFDNGCRLEFWNNSRLQKTSYVAMYYGDPGYHDASVKLNKQTAVQQ